MKDVAPLRIVCGIFVFASLFVLITIGPSRFGYSPAKLFTSSSTIFEGESSSSSSSSSVKLGNSNDDDEKTTTVQSQSISGGVDNSSSSSSLSSAGIAPPKPRVNHPGGGGGVEPLQSITDQTTEADAKRRRRSSRSSKDNNNNNNPRSILEKGLARARAAIRLSASDEQWKRSVNDSDFPTDEASLSVYRNPAAFYRSYKEMESRFKVYVYKEGEPPILHTGPCKNIYTTEGRFIHEMESSSSSSSFQHNRFLTTNPDKSHVFFMPFSVTSMVQYIYTPNTFNLTPLTTFVSDYITTISHIHPFWNLTKGADHFMLACHDWGPHASRGHKELYKNSIRVLCNANMSEGFDPRKDVTLPEINLRTGNVHPKLVRNDSTRRRGNIHRSNLAFFAGGVHGPIRPLLLSEWKGKDKEMLVYEYLPQGKSTQDDYYDYMLRSKYCLCPSGYEVASPRIVEAIYAECVPVILSVDYVLPFSDVLDWEKFAVIVDVKEMKRLKEILIGISDDKYGKLVEGVKSVRKHFEVNKPIKRFDFFHMVLHSVWLRRLNLRIYK